MSKFGEPHEAVVCVSCNDAIMPPGAVEQTCTGCLDRILDSMDAPRFPLRLDPSQDLALRLAPVQEQEWGERLWLALLDEFKGEQ